MPYERVVATGIGRAKQPLQVSLVTYKTNDKVHLKVGRAGWNQYSTPQSIELDLELIEGMMDALVMAKAYLKGDHTAIPVPEDQLEEEK